MGWSAVRHSWRAAAIGAGLAGLVCLAYGPAQLLPFISDDYLHIRLAREYGPPDGWSRLLADPLYRCRSLSLVQAWLIDRWFGPNPFVFGLSSLLLHWWNCILVVLLGTWKRIGWHVSIPAAVFFAVFEGPQEAVVWFAASPELHVFAFLLGAILCWIAWLRSQTRGVWWYSACLLSFTFALLSKESAAILPAFLGLVLLAENERSPKRWAAILPFCVMSLAYFAAGYLNRGEHLHYNDGTFNLMAPVWLTLPRSMARMFWIWGLASLLVLRIWQPAQVRFAGLFAVGWMAMGLLPYSFLTYMTRVPSRHTYLAAAGLALLTGWAAATIREHVPKQRMAAAFAAALIVLSNAGYLWTRKHQQYVERAEPTEELLRRLNSGDGPLKVCGFPYSRDIAESVLLVSGTPVERLEFDSGPGCVREP